MGEAGDGSWAAFECVENAPRQNGKNVLLEVRELYGLFLADEELIIHTAHEFKTCKESFRRLLGHIEGNPEWARKVRKVLTNNQETSIELTTGQRIKFIARKTNTGRGFTADLLVFDEAFALQTEAIAAVLPTLATRPNPQVWYTSSAGFASSDHFKSLRARGMGGVDPDLAYIEWSIPDEAVRGLRWSDPDEAVRVLSDPDLWRMANPALGIRISEGFVRKELSTMRADPRKFARERLGIWSDEAAETAIPNDSWVAAQDGTAQPGRPLVLGVEIHGDNEAGAIVASDGKTLEVVEHGAGAEWLASRVAALCARHRPSAVAIDTTGPARSLVPELEGKGFALVKFGGAEMAAACTAFLSDLVEGRVKVRPHPALDVAAAGAEKKPTGDNWVWRRGDDDLAALNAATVAWWQAKQPAPRAGIVSFAD